MCFEHLLYSGRSRLLRLSDCLLGCLVQFIYRARDNVSRGFARGIDHAGNFAAVVHHAAREGKTPFFDRLDCLIGCGGDVARELRTLLGDRRENATALFRKDGRHFGRTAADGGRNLLGLAHKTTGDFLADAEESALGIIRTGADRLRGGQRELAK